LHRRSDRDAEQAGRKHARDLTLEEQKQVIAARLDTPRSESAPEPVGLGASVARTPKADAAEWRAVHGIQPERSKAERAAMPSRIDRSAEYAKRNRERRRRGARRCAMDAGPTVTRSGGAM
jgi:hypothetical protein